MSPSSFLYLSCSRFPSPWSCNISPRYPSGTSQQNMCTPLSLQTNPSCPRLTTGQAGLLGWPCTATGFNSACKQQPLLFKSAHCPNHSWGIHFCLPAKRKCLSCTTHPWVQRIKALGFSLKIINLRFPFHTVLVCVGFFFVNYFCKKTGFDCWKNYWFYFKLTRIRPSIKIIHCLQRDGFCCFGNTILFAIKAFNFVLKAAVRLLGLNALSCSTKKRGQNREELSNLSGEKIAVKHSLEPSRWGKVFCYNNKRTHFLSVKVPLSSFVHRMLKFCL